MEPGWLVFHFLYHFTTWPRSQAVFHQIFFSVPHFSLFSFWHSNDTNIRLLVLSYSSLMFCLFFFMFFFSSLYLFSTFFLCSDWTIFIHQSSFTFSSAISILFRSQLLNILALKFPFSISLCLLFLFWEFYFPFVLRVFLALFLVEEVL